MARQRSRNASGRPAAGSSVNVSTRPRSFIFGYRKLNEGSFWAKPMTARLAFQFDEHWQFNYVELAIYPYHFPEIEN